MKDRAEMLCSRDKCMIDTDVMEMVNRGASSGLETGSGYGGAAPGIGWTATNYTEFWGRTLEEGISLRLGTLQPSDAVS